MKTLASLLGWALVAVAVGTADEPVVKIPAEVQARPGRLLRLQAETNGKVIRWACTAEEVDLIPFPPDGKTVLFNVPKPGRYRVLAWTALADMPSEAAVCVVVVAEPTPPDPFVTALQNAFASEVDPDRLQQKNALAVLYQRSVVLVARPELTTWGQLFDLMKDEAHSLGINGKLKLVQTAIQSELKSTLPSQREAPLDAAGRELAGKTFQKVATALEKVR